MVALLWWIENVCFFLDHPVENVIFVWVVSAVNADCCCVLTTVMCSCLGDSRENSESASNDEGAGHWMGDS